MATSAHRSLSAEERLIYLAIIATWPVYFVGGLYVLGSVIGWAVLLVIFLKYYIGCVKSYQPFPALASLWIIGVLLLQLCLLMAHWDWDHGFAKTLKSTIGWAKGWALFAVFIFCGAVLRFDPKMLSRACCIVATQAVFFAVATLVLYFIGGPSTLFVSKLELIGGPGPEFFEVRLFGINPETGLPRWFFIAPWAPAAGLLSCVWLLICRHESNRLLRLAAYFGCFLVCLLSQSRAGWIVFVSIFPIVFFAQHLTQRWMVLAISIALPLLVLASLPLFEMVSDSLQMIKDSRPGSSRVRQLLADIALQRWQTEAFWWGHGIVESGPKAVEFMPIGSHHSWYGLLFVKGAIGLMAFLLPLVMSLLYLVFRASSSSANATGFGLLLVLALYSFSENLEILAYLFWPALLWVGHSLNPANEKAPV